MIPSDMPEPVAGPLDLAQGRRATVSRCLLPHVALVLASKAVILGARITLAAFRWPNAQRLSEARIWALQDLSSHAAMAGLDFPVDAQHEPGRVFSPEELCELGGLLGAFAEDIAPRAEPRAEASCGRPQAADKLMTAHLRLMEHARRRCGTDDPSTA